jgi:hypothetical protein
MNPAHPPQIHLRHGEVSFIHQPHLTSRQSRS